MNIIISAPMGDRANNRAEDTIARYVGAPSFDRINAIDVCTVLAFKDVSELTQHLRHARPAVVFFKQGAISAPEQMLIAVDAVKRYREQSGRPNVLAVYVTVEDEGAVVLTDRYNPKGRDARKAPEGFTIGDYLETLTLFINSNAPAHMESWNAIKNALKNSYQSDDALTVVAYPGAEGYAEAFGLLIEEALKQDKRHGADRTYSLLEWLAVVNEEVLEFTREVVALATTDPSPQSKAEILANAKAELIQVGALCLQVIKSFYGKRTNEFKRDHTLDILVKLVADVEAIGGAPASRDILNRLDEDTTIYGGTEGPVCLVNPTVADLTPDQRPAMHEFLLTLLRKYEEQ